MQELPLEKIKQIGEMFGGKKERGRMLFRKQKQESIRRQEESAVQSKAGNKLLMKRFWELWITSMTQIRLCGGKKNSSLPRK